MSLDTTDDLHQAEDLIGQCQGALYTLMTEPFATLPIQLYRELETYCRPTCQSQGGTGDDGFCYDGVPSESCGCPCHGGDDEEDNG